MCRSAALPDRVTLIDCQSVDSTNQVARGMVQNGTARPWTVISAVSQTSGRGRRGRDWVSPAGNLYTSTIVYPAAAASSRAQLSLVVALAVAEMAADVVAGARVTLKWPNDVLVAGCKVSGILLESCPGPAGQEGVIIGTGINVAHAPADTRYGAAALARFAAAPVSRNWCLARYLQALACWYEIWSDDGFDPIRTGWLARAHGLGARTSVSCHDVERYGRFAGLTSEGLMLLHGEDGTLHEIAAGTVGFSDPEVM